MCVNKFILITVNNNFFLNQVFQNSFDIKKQFPRSVLLEEGVLLVRCEFSGGASMRGCDFNKVAKHLYCFLRPLFSVVLLLEIALCLEIIFLEKTSWGLLFNATYDDILFLCICFFLCIFSGTSLLNIHWISGTKTILSL